MGQVLLLAAVLVFPLIYAVQRVLIWLVVKKVNDNEQSREVNVSSSGWLSIHDLSVRLSVAGWTTYATIKTVKLSSSLFNSQASKPISLLIDGITFELEYKGHTKAAKEQDDSGNTRSTSHLPWIVGYVGATVTNLVCTLRDDTMLADRNVQISLLRMVLSLSEVEQACVTSRLTLEEFSISLLRGADLAETSLTDRIISRVKLKSLRIHSNVDISSKYVHYCDIRMDIPWIQFYEDLLDYLVELRHTRAITPKPDVDQTMRPDSQNITLPHPDMSSPTTMPPLEKLSSRVGILSLYLSQPNLVMHRVSKERSIFICAENIKLELTSSKENGSVLNSELSVNDLYGNCDVQKLICLQHLSVNAKVDLTTVDINSTINLPYLDYIQQDFEYWSMSLARLKPLPKQTSSSRASDKGTSFMQMVSSKSISASCDISGLNFSSTLPDNKGFSSGFEMLTLGAKSQPSSGFDVTCEMRKLYSFPKKSQLSVASLSPDQHMWGTIIYCDHISLKLYRSERLSRYDLSVELSDLQGEWSSDLVQYIVETVVSLQQYYRLFVKPSQQATDAELNSIKADRPHVKFADTLYVNISLSNVHLFACNAHHVCLMTALNKATLSIVNDSSAITVRGCSLRYLKQEKEGLNLLSVNTCDVPYAVKIDEVAVGYSSLSKLANITVLGMVQISWCYELHMCLWTAIQDGVHMRDQLKAALISHTAVSSSHTTRTVKSATEKKLSLTVTLSTGAQLTANINQGHSIELSVPAVMASCGTDQIVKLRSDTLSLSFDGVRVVQCEALSVTVTSQEQRLLIERKALNELEVKQNKAVCVHLTALNFLFPHKFDFASCFNEMINTIKWLKLVMRLRSKPFKLDSPLPRDIWLRVDNFSLIIADDLFEVKLGDNYALLVDEHMESEKRRLAMEAKLDELRSANKFIQRDKLKELYASLANKNSEIYVKRSRQLYSKADFSNRALFTVSLSNVEIIALADTSYHGTERVVQQMKEMDAESPLPADIHFLTLWCRTVIAKLCSLHISLRDYPLHLLDVSDAQIFGRLIGAESQGSARAIRQCLVSVSEPWSDALVDRNMCPLKFYHDLSMDMKSFHVTFGTCWENTLAQMNQAFDLINSPSVDPSLPMPFWDKSRLLVHGRLTTAINNMKWIYSVSQDPYNSAELLDWTWNNAVTDWTNGRWLIKGDLEVYARTASLYDECCLLSIPNVRLSIKLVWNTLGNPNAHHDVMPCADDKVPEFFHQRHDSFRAFRSESWDVILKIDCKQEDVTPTCLLYSSSLRFLDSWRNCMAATTRPTTTGKVFNVIRPRKPKLMKHMRLMSLSATLPCFSVSYWISHSKQKGFQITCDQFSLNSLQEQSEVPSNNEGMIRRAQTTWDVKKFSAELRQCVIHLCSVDEVFDVRSSGGMDQDKGVASTPLQEEDTLSRESQWTAQKTKERSKSRKSNSSEKTTADRMLKPDIDTQSVTSNVSSTGSVNSVSMGKVIKTQLVSIEKVSYHRTEDSKLLSASTHEPGGIPAVHKLRIYDSKLQWTAHNRDVCFAIFDGYQKANALKNNLSASAIRQINTKKDDSIKPTQDDRRSRSSSLLVSTSAAAPLLADSRAHDLLQQLVTDSESRFVVHSEDGEHSENSEQLRGVKICQKDDVLTKNIHVEMLRTQVRLHGLEQPGYLIISAGKASLVQCFCQPVWNRREVKSKTTYLASVDCMQYYATMMNSTSPVWLSRENIEDTTPHDHGGPVADLLSSTQPPVGGVISQSHGDSTVELQRVISRCKCQLFYASYGEVGIDQMRHVPPMPSHQSSGVMEVQEGIDTFTLLHHDVCISSNSPQFSLILDIVNKLLLYVEPKRKELTDKVEEMKFSLQLANETSAQKTPILDLQRDLRLLVSQLRQLERNQYQIRKALNTAHIESDQRSVLESDLNYLRRDMELVKEEVAVMNRDLSILISCYHQLQLQGANVENQTSRDNTVYESRRNEVCFMHASWRLTEQDGQVGLADLALRNFVYTKLTHSDDSGSHQLELGWIHVTNLLPDSPYREVLRTEERAGSSRRLALRIYTRDQPPVGGIGIKEHFEVNLEPLSIQVTHKFYSVIMGFFFPSNTEMSKGATATGTNRKSTIGSKSAEHVGRRGSVKSRLVSKSDSRTSIDIMRKRASQNQLFLYVKCPEVLLRISYKGSKDKNIADINDFAFSTPILEYHNKTWTWRDMVEQIKSDLKMLVLSQAIKHKLRGNKSKFYVESLAGIAPILDDSLHDEEKAKLLLGDHSSTDNKSSKKGLGSQKTKKKAS